MYDRISLAHYFLAKPALIALCVVGGLAVLAILVAIIAYMRHRNRAQATINNGKVTRNLVQKE